MTSLKGSDSSTNAKIGSSIIGIALGTGAILLAQSISPPNNLSKFLIVIAPALAVVGDNLFALIVAYYNNYRQKQTADEARSQIAEFIRNPNTSDEHKATLRQKMEELELKTIDLIDAKLLNSTLNERITQTNSRKPKKSGGKLLGATSE